MTAILSSIFFFIIALGTLIVFHEFGHYWTARRFGVKVLRFSVGFGKPLVQWRGGADNTEYMVAAIPLGGYVKMLDEREGPVDPREVHRAFNRQPLYSRFAIVAAGPVFNFIFAILAYWLVFIIGVSGVKPMVGEVTPGSLAAQGGFKNQDLILTIAGKNVQTWDGAVLTLLNRGLRDETVEINVHDAQGQAQTRVLDLNGISKGLDQGNLLEHLGLQPARPHIPAVIGQIEAGSPAAQAGLQPGDLIVAANGKQVANWDDWVNEVRNKPGQALQIEIERKGERQTLALTPMAVEGEQGKKIGRIGAGVQVPKEATEAMIAIQKYGVMEALAVASSKTWEISVLTLRMLGKMIIGDVSLNNLSGPISIAQYAGYSASIGFVSFFSFLAVISISLGVLNLLPVPILDGGHLFYYLIEFVKGSPLSEQMQLFGQKIGMAIILVLMFFAFYNDLVRVFQ